MRFFLSIVSFVCLMVSGMSFIACSDGGKSTAGIEIGNPSIADKDTVAADSTKQSDSVESSLAFTANFAVDYDNAVLSGKTALAKVAASDEPMLLDTFDLSLAGIRTFSSYYYVYIPGYDAVEGLLVWPEGNDSLVVSFAEGTHVVDPFKNIKLLDGGYLKEIGVAFAPHGNIKGRVLVNGEYVPFVMDLVSASTVQLRYHYSQIEIDSVKNTANLPVNFYPHVFADSIDFSSAEIRDGVIYIDSLNNTAIWETLKSRFAPSFLPLRYDANGTESYVDDVWKNLAADINENTIINGNFRSPFTTDWILVTQYGGQADTALIQENSTERIMEVNVTAGGDSSFSVQLLQENVALIAGVKYKCVFTIWSDIAGQITARIGSYDTYKMVGFSEHVQVTTSGQSVEIEFTPEVDDPFARFELNLGKEVRSFWIKEVQVLRLN